MHLFCAVSKQNLNCHSFLEKKAEYGKEKKKKVLGVHLKINSEILARNKE